MKKLYRSKKDRKIAGICGGIGEYFTIDANVIRVGFILLFALGGVPGLFAYALLWLIIPDSPVTTDN